MIQYSADGNIAFYDGYKFRRDQKTGYFLCTKKTDVGRRERLHVYVWRKANGDIPTGYHIHHVNEDKQNNELENLTCIQKSSHLSLHGKEHAEIHRNEVIDNLIKNALPAAVSWHKSQEGILWHSQHYREIIKNLKEKEYICLQCGKHFWAKPIGHEKKYCCNSCKAKARAQSGVDNELRRCEICGKQFEINRYSKKRCCSGECRALLRKNTIHKARGK